MKRLCAWILALVLLLSATALASVAPEADKTVLKAGDTVNVAVKLDAPIEGVYGLSYDLYFNSDLFDYAPSGSVAGDAIAGVQASAKAKTDKDGKQYVLISYVDLTAAGQTVAAGTLYTIAFTAKADIADDTQASFELKKEKVRDTSRNEITGETVDVPADKATLNVTVQTNAPTIALGEQRTISAKAGQEIEVPVYFNNTPTVGMAAFMVEFDSEKLSYAGESHDGSIAENNLNVAAVEGSENRIMVSTLGMPITETGKLCTLRFTVKDTAVAGDSAAITLPSVTVDDTSYPMVLDENMLPVGGMKYAVLTVNVVAEPKVTAIELDKNSISLTVGGTDTLIAAVTADEGADTHVTWESADSEIASVDENGKVTAHKLGVTTITAKAGGLSAACEVTVNNAVETGSYAVKMDPAVTENVKIGDTVTINVVVNDETRKTYNAVYMKIGYDPAMLTYAGETTIPFGHIYDDKDNGTLTLARYGDDANVGEALVALKFTVLKAGETKVEFNSAKVDESANAEMQDAPEATIVNFAIIRVGGYNVTLPDDFTGDAATKPGEDYTFSGKDPEHYDYSDVKAEIDGKDVGVIDNGDGSFTIKADDITGDITISGTATGKKYNVSFEGPDAGDVVKPENQPQYGVDYSFSVSGDTTKYNYTITAKIGDVELKVTSNGNGSYTISGNQITGDIVVSVSKKYVGPIDPSQNTVIIIQGVSDSEVEGGLTHTAPNGQDYTLKLIKDAAYDYEVKLSDGTVLKPNADGSYTIPGDKLTGTTLTVTVTKSYAKPTVEVKEYLKLKEAEGETSGQSMWLVLVSGTPADGNVYTFDGNAMFKTEGVYGDAYYYLMISGKTIDEVRADAAALVDQKAGTPSAISYEGDVNGTDTVDINDAQLVYDMYNHKYAGFTQRLAVENFLRADMDCGESITVKDAALIVAKFHKEFPVD